MFDYSAARTAMVDGQIRPADVTQYPVLEAMSHVPRELYVPSDKKTYAYADEQLVIEQGRTLLDPRSFAKMINNLRIKPNEMVLDIGAGYGYSSAILSRLAELVVAVEEDPSMADIAQSTLSEQSADNVVVHQSKLTAGAPEHGPYDVIILEGGVQTVPDELVSQIKEGGRIAAIFVNDHVGRCRIGYKKESVISWSDEFDVMTPVLPGFEVEKEFSF